MARFQSIPIADIKQATRRTEQVTVRVMRLWYRESESRPDDAKGVELILIDANGDTIQATINKRLTRLFFEQLNEGSTYIIKRFSTSSNRVGLDMATFHPCKIWFEYNIRVFPITKEEILDCVHAFYTFHEVNLGAMSDRLYIDVIGRNQLLCCSVFGDYVDQITKIEQDFSTQKKPTLLMLFVKRSAYEEEVSITTTTWGATKILVNPNMPQVNELNNSFPGGDDNDGGALEIVAYQPPILASANIKTLSEIEKLTKGGAYVTMTKFLELDTSTNSWFYNSCKQYRSKVNQGGDGLWYCEKERGVNPCTVKGMGMSYAIPRFQVKFFDDVMTELLGKIVQAILDEDEIRVTQVFNIEQKSSSYGVINLYDDPRIITKWKAINDAIKEQAISTSCKDTTKIDSMMNSDEITPQKSVMLLAEASDKSSTTKLQEIKMGKQPMGF
ncbi:uncharacterized protein LOC141632740 [Silene latifolia]|uniref:uncharacterized protein LOC141632740 n=1 Tax=Silene latifolia TaxID=37657 RepID=UPI003D76CFE9